VVLVGPPGAGRTSLVAALAARAGARGVAPGPPGALSAAVVTHAGVPLTLLDAPGAPELRGVVQAGLRAADAAG
jgi:ribosome-interacting GTPase 1